MAINRLRKFRTIDEVQTFLNGGVWSGSKIQQVQGPPSNQGPGITGLVGLTLIFVGPGPTGTVTFVASSGSNADPNTLLFSDIKAQIQAAIATLSVTTFDGYLTIQEVTPANGVTVSSAGTANTLLGFDSGHNTVGRFYLPAASSATPTPPYWVWAYSGNDNMHNVYTFEV
jgi:hypothetical protein